MLPRSKRLSASDVRKVMARGRGSRGKTLSLKILDSKESFRCAVVVSKKVAGTAVKRNQLRRAVFQALQSASLPPTGHVILFVQSIPEDPAHMFISEIKILLHV